MNTRKVKSNREPEMLGVLPTQSTSSTPYAWVHTVDIDRNIGPPNEWRDELNIFRRAGKNDRVHVYINSDGGYLSTTMALMNAMEECQAHITTELVGGACSAATAIFLKGDELIVNDMSLHFMIHQPSHGYSGVDHHVFDYAKHTRETSKNFIKQCYKGFLTKKEMKKVLNGKEMWLSPEEVLERCKKMREKESTGNTITREGLEGMEKDEILDLLFPKQPVDTTEE